MRAIPHSNQNARESRRNLTPRMQAGFTLVELLVVIALTSILLTVIFIPLVNSYALTTKADVQIQGQATSRQVLSNLTNLLSNADFVYDNAVTTQVNSKGQTITGSEINLWLVDSGGNQYAQPVNFAMLEAVTPARQLEQSPYTYDAAGNPVAVPIDPTTNQPIYDPSLAPGLSGFQLPLAPGRVLTRVFVGLINNASTGAGVPTTAYVNPYEDIRARTDNRYTLYRADVTAYIQDPTTGGPITDKTPYVPNLGLFHTVNSTTGAVTDSVNDVLRLHDPNFFYDNSPAGGNAGNSTKWAVKGWVDLNHDGICEIWENWAAVATSLMPKERVDLVALDRDANTNQILYYDNNGVPSPTGKPNVHTLAVFKPTYVQNDIAVPTSMDNSGNENPRGPSTTYITQYAHWTRPYRVTVYRAANGADPVNQNPLEFYTAIGAYSGDTRIFHVTNQALGAAPPQFPGAFADVGPQPDPTTGAFTNLTSPFAFSVNADKGTVNFAYPQSATVNSGAGTTPPYQPLPQRYSPVDVNNSDAPNFARRYIDLRATLPSALNPASAVSPLNTGAPWYGDVHIVPGSETVFGPDQRPGPHYGYRIRYTRVSSYASTVGPNQYRINYENNSNSSGFTDPSLFLGYIEFQQGVDPNPTVLDDPGNGIFKPVVMPTRKADLTTTGANLTADPIEVSYQFTMIRPNDVVKVDYMSRDLVNIALETRLYDPHSGQPQIISLADKIKVRNLQH